jgi:hypothetical protein
MRLAPINLKMMILYGSWMQGQKPVDPKPTAYYPLLLSDSPPHWTGMAKQVLAAHHVPEAYYTYTAAQADETILLGFEIQMRSRSPMLAPTWYQIRHHQLHSGSEHRLLCVSLTNNTGMAQNRRETS